MAQISVRNGVLYVSFGDRTVNESRFMQVVGRLISIGAVVVMATLADEREAPIRVRLIDGVEHWAQALTESLSAHELTDIDEDAAEANQAFGRVITVGLIVVTRENFDQVVTGLNIDPEPLRRMMRASAARFN